MSLKIKYQILNYSCEPVQIIELSTWWGQTWWISANL